MCLNKPYGIDIDPLTQVRQADYLEVCLSSYVCKSYELSLVEIFNCEVELSVNRFPST